MGQDWARNDPSWSPEVSLVSQSFPNPLDLGRDLGRGMPYRPSPHPHIERDFGPDLGLGL